MPSPTAPTTRSQRRRRLTAIATLAVASLGVAGALAPSAFAQETGTQDPSSQSQEQPPNQDGNQGDRQRPPHPKLTDEQKACLEEQGVEKPAKNADGTRAEPTDEQRAKFEAAAKTCNIDISKRPGRPELTDEQKACLEEQGITKPAKNADGTKPERTKPTDEQRAKFEAAAEACGIDLPEPPAEGQNGNPPADAPADAPATNAA